MCIQENGGSLVASHTSVQQSRVNYHELVRFRSSFLPGLVSGLVLGIVLLSIVWLWRSRAHGPAEKTDTSSAAGSSSPSQSPSTQADLSATRIHAHNLLLRKGPNFRVYVRWLDGQLARTHPHVNPSFDDPDSFYLNIQSGVLRANIGDLGTFLNAGLTNSPLKNLHLQAEGDQLKLTGTIKKIVPLPIQLMGRISAMADNRIRLQVTKLDVLKVPVKGLLGIFKISVADLFKGSIEGVEIDGNDLFFDTQKLMPPPRIRGTLTTARIVSPDIEEVYGNASADVERVELWRNFLSLKGGSINFGKLTMNNVDLMMIDISKDPWFDLDLVNYQAQLTGGYTRVTPQMGLQIFMPDLRDIQITKNPQDTNIEWFKNRSIPPPPQITTNIH